MFSFVYPGNVITKDVVQKILRMGPSRCFLFLFHMYVEFVFELPAYQLEFPSEECPQILWRWG